MLVKSIQRFLASAARRAIKRERPTIVAITGSVGKSSAKEAIAVALGAREPGTDVRATIRNYNNEYGLPFTIFNVRAPGRDPFAWLTVLWRAFWVGWGMGRIGAATLVLEMSADHKGDLSWLTSIARPDISVVTAIAPAHAEYIGTLDEIAHEKATLVRALANDGLAILNADDPLVTAMRKETRAETVYVGESEGSDVRVRDVRVAAETDERGHVMPRGLEVAVEFGDRSPIIGLQQVSRPDSGRPSSFDQSPVASAQTSRFELRGTIGHPQAWAAGAAFAVARALRVPPDAVIQRLERDYHGMAGRTRIIPGIKYTALIDDSYNAASPTAVISGLSDVASIQINKTSQRRIAALGDMRELGAYSDEAHRAVGQEVAAQGFDMLVTCGKLARDIASAAREAGMPPENVLSFDATEEGGRALQDIIRSGDIVYVKGSQGSRMEKVVKELMAEPLQAPFLLVRMTEEWAKTP